MRPGAGARNEHRRSRWDAWQLAWARCRAFRCDYVFFCLPPSFLRSGGPAVTCIRESNHHRYSRFISQYRKVHGIKTAQLVCTLQGALSLLSTHASGLISGAAKSFTKRASHRPQGQVPSVHTRGALKKLRRSAVPSAAFLRFSVLERSFCARLFLAWHGTQSVWKFCRSDSPPPSATATT